jgi:hypothetical protein
MESAPQRKIVRLNFNAAGEMTAVYSGNDGKPIINTPFCKSAAIRC